MYDVTSSISSYLLPLVLTGTAGAQSHVRWDAVPAVRTVSRGDTTSVTISATIQKGWHIYSLTQGPGGPEPTRITLPQGKPSFSLAGDVKAPAPAVEFDKTIGIKIESYDDKADFTVPIQVSAAAKPGVGHLVLRAYYQVCSSHFCLTPSSQDFPIALKVKKVAHS